MTIYEKLKKLEYILNDLGRITVALSGGVDSVFLLTFAYKLWGDDRVSAVTAQGPHFADDETAYADYLCSELGIKHDIASVDHILSVIADNPPDRCYICKREIFSSIKEIAEKQGRNLVDGTNLDDLDDYRPGYKALQELGISSPLKDAGLTKSEIRKSLRKLSDTDPFIKQALMIPSDDGKTFPIWEKPAFACLASRIPYGQTITKEKLLSVYKAECFLKALGFTQIRVRHHGDVARIEVLPHDRKKFFDEKFMDKVNDEIKKCGFRFAALDLGGYKMGNLN
ncbi:ATP-dependent sacrificial sulfur transferase LarE [Mogibacterium sp. NSJ-24]|jgi:pyridinium-3,5-biscarboxylic acid mononucleotide sulfurtransferase|uniref:ATP-dependent sacrificial sulfur transferase LarE n=1 Tax=Lentihominibacter hominis TaxID=2763645 RepID=A0A926E7Z9_9FIRM|nr:ATP-dependent sacrificial sulfur transferase LarE [Lentihominibacter hominis]MBC8568073.1 ATP-dependent sacrificial sulfur transferase LarE [Lentihominibacter hominis]